MSVLSMTEPVQLALLLPPGRPISGAPRQVYRRFTAEERRIAEMDDTIRGAGVDRRGCWEHAR